MPTYALIEFKSEASSIAVSEQCFGYPTIVVPLLQQALDAICRERSWPHGIPYSLARLGHRPGPSAAFFIAQDPECVHPLIETTERYVWRYAVFTDASPDATPRWEVQVFKDGQLAYTRQPLGQLLDTISGDIRAANQCYVKRHGHPQTMYLYLTLDRRRRIIQASELQDERHLSTHGTKLRVRLPWALGKGILRTQQANLAAVAPYMQPEELLALFRR